MKVTVLSKYNHGFGLFLLWGILMSKKVDRKKKEKKGRDREGDKERERERE